MLRPGVRTGRAERAMCEERGILVAEIAERARDPANRPLVLSLLWPFFDESGVPGNWCRMRNEPFGSADSDSDAPAAGAVRAC